MAQREAEHDFADGTGETFTVQRNIFREDTLFRYVNNLDVDVDIAVEGTDNYDTDLVETEELGAKTVLAGTVDSDYMTEPWEVVVVTVTPAATPTTGTFELRQITKR